MTNSIATARTRALFQKIAEPMGKIAGNEVKPGMIIEVNGQLWAVLKTNSVKPGKGGPRCVSIQSEHALTKSVVRTAPSSAVGLLHQVE